MEKVKDIEIRKEVLSLLTKLSCGWHRPHKEPNLISLRGISTWFLEYYKVNELLNLVCSVGIHEEKYDYNQILMVWDLSALSDIAKVAKKLDNFFWNYPFDVRSLCKYKHLEGYALCLYWFFLWFFLLGSNSG